MRSCRAQLDLVWRGTEGASKAILAASLVALLLAGEGVAQGGTCTVPRDVRVDHPPSELTGGTCASGEPSNYTRPRAETPRMRRRSCTSSGCTKARSAADGRVAGANTPRESCAFTFEPGRSRWSFS